MYKIKVYNNEIRINNLHHEEFFHSYNDLLDRYESLSKSKYCITVWGINKLSKTEKVWARVNGL